MPSCLWFLINICPGAQEERMNWLLWAQSPRRSRNLNLLHLKDSCSWGPSYPGICSCICYHPCCWKGGSSDRGCGGGAASWKAEKRGSPAEANVAKFKCCRNLPRRWSCSTLLIGRDKEPVTGEKPILSFETRSRIVFFQSRASRRERDFVHRISSLETRSRILFTESRASRRDREFCSPNLEIWDEIEIFQ